MAGIEEYRTPAEIAARCEERAYVRQVLSEAVDTGAHLVAAMTLAEPQEVVELWVNRLWRGLGERLDDGERLAAIVELLEARIEVEARRIVRQVPMGGEPS